MISLGPGEDSGEEPIVILPSDEEFFKPSSFEPGSTTNGKIYAVSTDIQNTEEDELYQSERWGNFRVEVPLEDGSYEVTLKFAEIWHTSAGMRSFQVYTEAKTADEVHHIESLDIFRTAGGAFRPYDVSFPVVVGHAGGEKSVKDGSLTIDFIKGVSDLDQAKVSSIVIQKKESSAQEQPPLPTVVVMAEDDSYFHPSSLIPGAETIGNIYSSTAEIANTDEDELYQSERWGDFRVEIPLPNGVYDVTLKMAELYFSGPNLRTFQVLTEAGTADEESRENHLDVFAQAGGEFRALDRRFRVTVGPGSAGQKTVKDGSLTIDFFSAQGDVDHPKIGAIVVQPANGPEPSPSSTPSPSATPTPTPTPTQTQTPPSGAEFPSEWYKPVIVSSGTVYVSINGNDSTGDGSADKPWRTLKHALSNVPANVGRTIQLSAGTFVEYGPLRVPEKVSIVGTGHSTILKGHPSMYFQYNGGAYPHEKGLLQLHSGTLVDGNQQVKNLTIDGDNKNLAGGILVFNRRDVLLTGLKVINTNFSGVWFWETRNSRVSNSVFRDCAWGGPGGASSCVCVWRSKQLEVDHLDVDAARNRTLGTCGYGHGPDAYLHSLKIHDNRFSVDGNGTWVNPDTGQPTPNINVEFWNAEIQDTDFYNNYFDNNVSVVIEPKWNSTLNRKRLRFSNNVFDLITRGNGGQLGIELMISDTEVDHNTFFGGTAAVGNYVHGERPKNLANWNIHHNVVHRITHYWPTQVVHSSTHLSNVNIDNNTIELEGGSTTHIFGIRQASEASNIKIRNNLIINSQTAAPWGAPKLMQVEPDGSSVINSIVENNRIQNVGATSMNLAAPAGAIFRNNLVIDPKIVRSGAKPTPYYAPLAGSPLIDQGLNLGYPFKGAGPDIGAIEY